MPTFKERLLNYESKLDGLKISNKLRRKMIHFVIAAFDRYPEKNPPLEYITTVENGVEMQVRNYPESFVRIMDSIIHSFFQRQLQNIEKAELEQKPKVKKAPPEPPKKQRTRKPIPAYSSKPKS